MIFNMGAMAPTFDLIVSGYPGATVTVTDGKKTWTQVTDSDGTTVFAKMKKGEYTVTAAAGGETASYYVTISRDSANMLNINAIPEFTYNGSYKIVNDSDNVITHAIKNWKIRFLTGGTLTFKKLNGAADGIDIFCVGGGGNGGTGIMFGAGATAGAGGGGGGGRTATKRGAAVGLTSYSIAVGGSGGTSSFANILSAAPGSNGGDGSKYGSSGDGGSGGSGGGGGSIIVANAKGGTNGSNGANADAAGNHAGYGWGGAGLDKATGTKEFHEANGQLYSTGGDGGGYGINGNPRTATANTGNGGGGGGSTAGGGSDSTGGDGSSGIVIIRNKR